MSQGNQGGLRGRFDHKLDPKNRIAIPADWGMEGKHLNLLETKRDGFPVIRVFTEEHYQEYENRIYQMAKSFDERDKLLGMLAERTLRSAVNAQGKLLIPKSIVDNGRLKGDVRIVGRGLHFELWEPSIHDQAYLKESSKIEEDKHKELGIF